MKRAFLPGFGHELAALLTLAHVLHGLTGEGLLAERPQIVPGDRGVVDTTPGCHAGLHPLEVAGRSDALADEVASGGGVAEVVGGQVREVRHVTLSTGQLGVAVPSLGWDVLHSNLLWWAVAMLPFNAALNVGVSFYLAFRVALRAHNVSGVDRSRIYKAIRQRFWHKPFSFFWP